MAHPITFKPAPVDPHMELMRRVEVAPREHAEALLVGWDLLQTAHDQGILDLLQGLLGGKDIITGKIAESVALPDSVAAIRNLISVTRVLASFDPEMLQRFARAMGDNKKQEENQQRMATEKEGNGPKLNPVATLQKPKPKPQSKPPSLWQIFRTATSADARRGIGFATGLLSSLGKATAGESGH